MPEMQGKLVRSMLEGLLSLTKMGAQGLRPKKTARTASQGSRSPARNPESAKRVGKDCVPSQPKNCISRATRCESSRCLRAMALTTWRRTCQEQKGLCCSQCRSWQTWSQYEAALQASTPGYLKAIWPDFVVAARSGLRILVCGGDLWRSRCCKTSPVDLQGFWIQVWPKIGRKLARKFPAGFAVRYPTHLLFE